MTGDRTRHGGRRRLVAALASAALACAALLSVVEAPVPAQAGTLRTRVFDFNACDQYQRNPECDATAAQRASAIVSSVVNGGSSVVTLQEVCRYTYDRILAGLGSRWRGAFLQTVALADDRCAPGARSWGIAFLARSPSVTAVASTQLPNPLGETELRHLLCGDVVVGTRLRACTSHFSVHAAASSAQAADVGARLVTATTGGTAVLLGVDANIDSRDCVAAAALAPIHIRSFGGTSDDLTCQTGIGVMYEADQRHTGGDGSYTAPTAGARKIDQVFFFSGRWYADYNGVTSTSWLSDHKVLRGEGTLHW